MKTGLLLSGGMDSIALAYWKRPDLAFTINYGQLGAVGEIRAAQTIAQELEIRHEIISVNCRELGSGDLAGEVQLETAPASEWWAFRNQLLLTLAGMSAIKLNLKTLMFGSVKSDCFHADGRMEFFQKIGELFEIQEGRLKVIAPAIHLTTAELVKTSKIPRSLLSWAHSCHISDYACGYCRGCTKYLSVMRELGYE
jgi:7-cyano-7-deazaguanine synthase